MTDSKIICGDPIDMEAKSFHEEGVLVPTEQWQMYQDALEVLKQIEKLPMESYHLENFKRKYSQEFR